MSPYLKWLIVVVAAAAVVLIGGPIVLRMIQDRDFRRQVEGKQPMRQAGENISPEQKPADPALEAEAMRIRAQSTQNLMGPK